MDRIHRKEPGSDHPLHDQILGSQERLKTCSGEEDIVLLHPRSVHIVIGTPRMGNKSDCAIDTNQVVKKDAAG